MECCQAPPPLPVGYRREQLFQLLFHSVWAQAITQVPLSMSSSCGQKGAFTSLSDKTR